MPRPIRVFHLPCNIASISSHTVRSLRESGIQARGITFGEPVISTDQGLRVIDDSARRYSARWLANKLRFWTSCLKGMLWADVLHWYFGAPALPFGLDMALVRYLKKPALAEWMGSEIRIPEVEFSENPYYRVAFERGYEYRSMESRSKSRELQRKFASAGFESGAALGMLQYVQQDLFVRQHVLAQRLVLSDYVPAFPDPQNRRPLVVHAPTAPVAKGTAAVRAAVDKLKKKYKFDFCLVENMRRQESLAWIRRADVFLDQFVLGDRGMAALEAMALGKPVVCYLKPSVVSLYPPDQPVVNANQDNLAEALEELLRDSERRHALGVRGRSYVERYHDGLVSAKQLTAIYGQIIERRRTG